MHRGTCLKCGSKTVFTKDDGIGFNGSYGVFVKTGMMGGHSNTVSYVCTTCGYLEIYISEKKKLENIAKKWQHVQPK